MNQENKQNLKQHHEAKKNVVINALSMAFGTLTSRALGLLRDMAFAAMFSRSITDAWTAAFRLPNLFRRLLGEGSLSISFIPVFVETRLEDEKIKAHQASNLVNGLYTCLLMVLIALTTLGIIFADRILVMLLDPAYVSNHAQFLLTVRMSKIMFGFIFLISHFAYYMGILNALGEYSLPALAPLFFNVAMIISTFIPINWFAEMGDGLAWGVLIGGLWQAVILIPSLIKKGYFPKISFAQCAHPKVKQAFKSMVPGLLGTGILQITTILNLRFASGLGEGAISYIYWADRLLELPLSLVAVSLGTALLPTLSKMWAEDSKGKLLETSQYYLRLNLFICLPAAVGLFALSTPIVEVLFQRGEFSEVDVIATALVVSIYSLILISSSSVRVLVPLYYSMKNTKWPAVMGVLSLISHVLWAPLLMKHWGLGGLVFSSFVSSMVNFLGLAIPINLKVGPYGWINLCKSFLKNLIAAICMGVLVYYINQTLRVYLGSGELGRSVNLFITLFIGIGVYIFMTYLFRSEELEVTYKTLKDKIKAKNKNASTRI